MARTPPTPCCNQCVSVDIRFDHDFRVCRPCLRSPPGTLFYGNNRADWNGVRLRCDSRAHTFVHGASTVQRPAPGRAALVAPTCNTMGAHSFRRQPGLPLLYFTAHSPTNFVVQGRCSFAPGYPMDGAR